MAPPGGHFRRSSDVTPRRKRRMFRPLLFQGGRREAEGRRGRRRRGVYLLYLFELSYFIPFQKCFIICVCVCVLLADECKPEMAIKNGVAFLPFNRRNFTQKKHNNKKKKTRQIQIQITAESQETKEERAWTQTPSIK